MVVARREVWSEKGDETVSRTVEEWGSGGAQVYKWAGGEGGGRSWRLENMLKGSIMGGIKLTAEAEWNKQTIAVKRTSGKGGRRRRRMRRRRVLRREKGVDTIPLQCGREPGAALQQHRSRDYACGSQAVRLRVLRLWLAELELRNLGD